MRNWRLQLQQEGDDCALPVETRELEILEGRYRLRIEQLPPDTSLRCRIVYHNPQEPGPRRVHETELCSNASGGLEVFPFTYLRPGVWDLEWPEQAENGVRLQVLARDAGDDPGEPPQTIAPIPEPEVALAPAPSPDPAPRLRILLRQSRFWVQPGELFTLSGELQWLGPTSPPIHFPEMRLAIDLWQEQAWICLHQTAPEPRSFPWSFSLPVTVPPHPETRTVQARVHLQWDDHELEECFELSLFQPEPLGQIVPDLEPTPDESFSIEPLAAPDGAAEAVRNGATEADPAAASGVSGVPISFTLTPGPNRSARSLDLPFAPASSLLGDAAIPAAIPFPEPPPPGPVPPVPGPSFLERLQSMIEAALPEPPRDPDESRPSSAPEHTPLPQTASAPPQDDDAVPPPQLEHRSPAMPGGHLEMAVSLPQSGVRRVVKLWLQDNRQQRRLGQLRLVADFTPLDTEQAIAQLRVHLPDDLSDLSIEAVTIELPSQRESQTVHLPLT